MKNDQHDNNNNLPQVGFAIKDKDSNYLYCNSFLSDILELDSPKDIHGKTDADFYRQSEACTYREGDKLILSGKSYENRVESLRINADTQKIITTKHQLINARGFVDGIIISFSVVPKAGLEYFTQNGKKYTAELPQHIGRLQLSKREITILKYITYGYTNALIAETLFISRRTVEHHIDNIKNKLQCKKREYLIQTLHELNLIGDLTAIWKTIE